jgi:hypothetical protein
MLRTGQFDQGKHSQQRQNPGGIFCCRDAKFCVFTRPAQGIGFSFVVVIDRVRKLKHTVNKVSSLRALRDLVVVQQLLTLSS